MKNTYFSLFLIVVYRIRGHTLTQSMINTHADNALLETKQNRHKFFGKKIVGKTFLETAHLGKQFLGNKFLVKKFSPKKFSVLGVLFIGLSGLWCFRSLAFAVFLVFGLCGLWSFCC